MFCFLCARQKCLVNNELILLDGASKKCENIFTCRLGSSAQKRTTSRLLCVTCVTYKKYLLVRRRNIFPHIPYICTAVQDASCLTSALFSRILHTLNILISTCPPAPPFCGRPKTRFRGNPTGLGFLAQAARVGPRHQGLNFLSLAILCLP